MINTTAAQVISKLEHPLPAYATEPSTGMDVHASLSEPMVLESLQHYLVPTSLHIALPAGLEAQIRPRNGLAIRKRVSVPNSPGTIDVDYCGEICIILMNPSSKRSVIEDGERTVQMIITRHEQAVWQGMGMLGETERSSNGFGHAGV